MNLRYENRLAEFWSGRKFHKKKRSLLRSLRPFAVEFFKTTLNLPPGCKRWIISFMGRAHRPSAIRHRLASALRPIRCRYIVMDVTCRDSVTLHPVMFGEFPVFADMSKHGIVRYSRSSPNRCDARKRELPVRDVDWAEQKDRAEKKAGSRAPRSGLLSLTEVPNTCGITARPSTSLVKKNESI